MQQLAEQIYDYEVGDLQHFYSKDLAESPAGKKAN